MEEHNTRIEGGMRCGGIYYIVCRYYAREYMGNGEEGVTWPVWGLSVESLQDNGPVI